MRALLATQLGRRLEHEAFWAGAIVFFVRHPELPLEQVGPVVDFLHHQFSPEVRGDDRVTPVSRAVFSSKGRTPTSLLRLVTAWHADLATAAATQAARWPRAPVGEFAEDRDDRAADAGAAHCSGP